MTRVGCCGFSFDEWVGTFYPKDLQSIDFLEYYSRYFDCVELDSTLYSVPKFDTVKRWHDVTPNDFLFFAKMPLKITHEKMLFDVKEETNYFLASIKPLRHKLGMVLILLPTKFTKDLYFERLRFYIQNFPREIPLAIEFGSMTWEDELVYHMLRKYSVILAWRASADRRLAKTAPLTYVRFIGAKTDTKTIDHQPDYIASRKELARFDHSEAYVVVNSHYEGFAPASAVKIKEVFGLEQRSWPTASQTQLAEFEST